LLDTDAATTQERSTYRMFWILAHNLLAYVDTHLLKPLFETRICCDIVAPFFATLGVVNQASL